MSNYAGAFRPAVLDSQNGNPDIDLAVKYLRLSDGPSTDVDADKPTKRTTTTKLVRLGRGMLHVNGPELIESQKQAEVSYYGAWSLLEASLPNYFTPFDETNTFDFEDDLISNDDDSTTATLMIEAFKYFEQIERRQPFIGSGVIPHKGYDPMLFKFGHRARMITDAKPYLVHEGNPERTITERQKRTSEAIKKVANNYARSAYYINQQIRELLNIRLTRELTDKEFVLLSDLKGLETENKLIGLLWRAHALGISPIIAFPASPRIDYGFSKPSNTKCDVVIIDTNTGKRAGFNVKHSAVTARSEFIEQDGVRVVVLKDMGSPHPRIAHLYGDRDLAIQTIVGILDEASAYKDGLQATAEYGFDDGLAFRIAWLAKGLIDRTEEQ